MKMIENKRVSDKVISGIMGCVMERTKEPIKDSHKRNRAKLTNLMVFAYLRDPEMRFGDCRAAVQPDIPEMRLEDSDIRSRADYNDLLSVGVRCDLVKWAHEVVQNIYLGMSGDGTALAKARRMLESAYDGGKKHVCQNNMVLFGMFEWIPQLADRTEKENLLLLGHRFSRLCLMSILDSVEYDITAADDSSDIDKIADVAALRREVHLARNELKEYRSLVEAADAEFENKLEEVTRQELTGFFSALNNEKYGYLIDSLYLQKKACTELARSGERLPYLVEGVPVFFDRLLSFLKDSGIAPVSRFAPHSKQQLTVAEMEGYRFEPHPERTEPIKPGEKITVKVISSGWKYGDIIISNPVLQEEFE